MLYTPLTRKAMKIAYNAHHGQVDYSGVPYVFHAYEVASEQKTETAVCAALLHDVVEDTEVTIEELKKEFPEEIIEIVELLTHDLDEDYAEYVGRIRRNSIAIAIKLSDLKHNSNESRLDGIETVTEEQRAWWKEKYKMAKNILEYGDPAMLKKLQRIRKEIFLNANETMEKHRFEVFRAIKQISEIIKTIEPLDGRRVGEKVEELETTGNSMDKFLADALWKITTMDFSVVEKMIVELDEKDCNPGEKYIKFIYTRGVMLLLLGNNMPNVEEFFLSMIPPRERTIYKGKRRT